jgi:hypothetical protein
MSVTVTTDTISVVRATIDNLATFIAENIGANPPTYDEMFSLIQTYVQVNQPIDIPLSQVSVDYETNKAEITSILTATQTWQDRTNAGTGETLIQMIATALTFNQFEIVRAAQETMIPTAVLDNSIFTGTIFLGVRLTRRVPAKHVVTLTRAGDLTNSLSLVAYTQFQSGGLFLFNRGPLTWPASIDTISADLFEGQTQNTGITSTGASYQSYTVGARDYTISDIDTVVLIDGIPWTRTQYQQYFNVGLWEYASDAQVFEDITTPDGNISINFGNGVNGQIPTAGSIITINYVSTSGAAGNVDITSSTISCGINQNVGGVVTLMGYGGDNERTASDYRTLSPGLFFAHYRAITRADQAAIARNYPSVIDAIFQGQQELHPDDLRYMMVTSVTLLTNTVWIQQQWDDFIAWFSNLNIAQQIVLRNDPVAIVIDISANVFVKPTASSLTIIQNLIAANLRAAFVPRVGSLGYSWYMSDIESIIKGSDPSVDYFDITLPYGDTIVTALQYVTLRNVTLNMSYSQRGVLS